MKNCTEKKNVISYFYFKISIWFYRKGLCISYCNNKMYNYFSYFNFNFFIWNFSQLISNTSLTIAIAIKIVKHISIAINKVKSFYRKKKKTIKPFDAFQHVHK